MAQMGPDFMTAQVLVSACAIEKLMLGGSPTLNQAREELEALQVLVYDASQYTGVFGMTGG